MDETPYLTELSQLTLDSLADFLMTRNPMHIRILYSQKSLLTFDSCVPCNFEQAMKDYLVTKGVQEGRIACNFRTEGKGDSDPVMDRIRHAFPQLENFSEYTLFVFESAP